jgi:hypothetical protein
MKKRAGRVFGCSSHMEMAIGSGYVTFIATGAKIGRAPLANASVRLCYKVKSAKLRQS